MRTFRFHSDNLDQITFEHRNKAYGAYELRTTKSSRVVKSFLTALISLSFLISVPVFIHHLLLKNPVVDDNIFVSTPVDLHNNFVVEQHPPATPPPHTPQQLTARPDAPFKIMSDSLITNDENKKDTVPKSSQVNTVVPGTSGDSSNTHVPGNPANPGNSGNGLTTAIASASPFSLAAVDTTPVFPGGDNLMMKFFEKNIHYNERARLAGIKGKVYASFIINSKGEVEAIKIIHSLGFGLDEEVMRVLAMMPKWKPGYFHGNAVSTIMNLPVSFNIIQ